MNACLKLIQWWHLLDLEGHLARDAHFHNRLGSSLAVLGLQESAYDQVAVLQRKRRPQTVQRFLVAREPGRDVASLQTILAALQVECLAS